MKGGDVNHISEHLCAPNRDELLAFVTVSIQSYNFDIDSAEKPFTNFDKGDDYLSIFRSYGKYENAIQQIIKARRFIRYPPTLCLYNLGIEYIKMYHRAFRALYIYQLLFWLPNKDRLHYENQLTMQYPDRLEDIAFRACFYTHRHYMKVALQFHKEDQKFLAKLMRSYLNIDDWEWVKQVLNLNESCNIFKYDVRQYNWLNWDAKS